MFDFKVAKEAISENGFQVESEAKNKVAVKLKNDLVLVFVNESDDTGIFFEGGNWHSHGDIWSAAYGIEEELVPLYILSDLKSGKLLIEKYIHNNGTIGLSLVYGNEVNFSAEDLESGEEVNYIKL